MRGAAERVADPDVAACVDRGARHPTIEALGRVRALLVQRHVAAPADSELVPAYAATTSGGVDGVDGDDRFAVTDPPIHQSRHDLVPLRIEAALDARLR